MRWCHMHYCHGIQSLDVTDGWDFPSSLWRNTFFRDKSQKVVTHLLRISTASLDAECLFLCPLFAFIFAAEDLVDLFAAAAPDGMKGKDD